MFVFFVIFFHLGGRIVAEFAALASVATVFSVEVAVVFHFPSVRLVFFNFGLKVMI